MSGRTKIAPASVVPQLKVLDLFAGLQGWSAPWAARGHLTFSVDYDPRFDVDLHHDIHDYRGVIDRLPWRPDVILASPPCEKFSVLTIGRNWTRKNQPKTQGAVEAIRLVTATLALIRALQPKWFVIENPRGKLRKLPYLKDLERITVTYCQYGMPYRKPTDLWGGFPDSFIPIKACEPLMPCHYQVPPELKGSRSHWSERSLVTREQQRYSSKDPRRKDAVAKVSMIPEALSVAICKAAEKDYLPYLELQ